MVLKTHSIRFAQQGLPYLVTFCGIRLWGERTTPSTLYMHHETSCQRCRKTRIWARNRYLGLHGALPRDWPRSWQRVLDDVTDATRFLAERLK